MDDGQFRHGDGYRIGLPVYTLFYVCPLTGILKKTRRESRRPWNDVEPLQIIPLADHTALVRFRAGWHLIRWQYLPEPGTTRAFQFRDELFKRNLYRETAISAYGRPIHAIDARPAKKCEVRQVVNSYPLPNRVR